MQVTFGHWELSCSQCRGRSWWCTVDNQVMLRYWKSVALDFKVVISVSLTQTKARGGSNVLGQTLLKVNIIWSHYRQSVVQRVGRGTYSSMTAALEGGEWPAARPGRSLTQERPGTHCIGGWVDPRAGLDGFEYDFLSVLIEKNYAHHWPQTQKTTFFDVLLTVPLSIFISVINQLDAQNFCFTLSLFHASTCFEHMCSSSGGQICITQPLVSSNL